MQKNKERYYRVIEMLGYWHTGVNAPILARQFNVSEKHAKNHLSDYRQAFPHNLTYDKSAKCYKATEHFRASHIQHDVNEYLDWLVAQPGVANAQFAAHTQVLHCPQRTISPNIMRPLIAALQNGAGVDVHYHSMSQPQGAERVIYPHALIKTGLRWHLRGYCELKQDFRDFVLSRFRGKPTLDDSRNAPDSKTDHAWHTQVQIVLTPNPKLAPEQQALIAQDYDMQHRQLTLTTRGALVHYLLQQLQVQVPANPNSQAQPLVLVNQQDVRHWLFNQ